MQTGPQGVWSKTENCANIKSLLRLVSMSSGKVFPESNNEGRGLQNEMRSTCKQCDWRRQSTSDFYLLVITLARRTREREFRSQGTSPRKQPNFLCCTRKVNTASGALNQPDYFYYSLEGVVIGLVIINGRNQAQNSPHVRPKFWGLLALQFPLKRRGLFHPRIPKTPSFQLNGFISLTLFYDRQRSVLNAR